MTSEQYPPLDLASLPDNPAPPGAIVTRIKTTEGMALRVARWPAGAPPRGTSAVLPDYAECIEIYFEVVRELLERGFAVAVMDWRGQGLSTPPSPTRAKAIARISLPIRTICSRCSKLASYSHFTAYASSWSDR